MIYLGIYFIGVITAYATMRISFGYSETWAEVGQLFKWSILSYLMVIIVLVLSAMDYMEKREINFPKIKIFKMKLPKIKPPKFL